MEKLEFLRLVRGPDLQCPLELLDRVYKSALYTERVPAYDMLLALPATGFWIWVFDLIV